MNGISVLTMIARLGISNMLDVIPQVRVNSLTWDIH